MFRPDQFFELQNFSHKDLFLLRAPIWETLKNLKSYLEKIPLGKIDSFVSEGTTLVHPEKIAIGTNVKIEPGAYIEGPCVIGEGSEIRQGAYIRPYVITGKNCVIGHATELKHAILLDGAKASHFNYVGDSILGNDVNIGAGVICANVRLDRQEVVIKVGDQRFQSGMKKFGAVLGDKTQIGCNSVINPGILLKKGFLSRACQSVEQSNVRILKDAQADLT